MLEYEVIQKGRDICPCCKQRGVIEYSGYQIPATHICIMCGAALRMKEK